AALTAADTAIAVVSKTILSELRIFMWSIPSFSGSLDEYTVCCHVGYPQKVHFHRVFKGS
ncbi:MAG: hypothetical protein WBN37_03805, partial [Arenicellales bacterium]